VSTKDSYATQVLPVLPADSEFWKRVFVDESHENKGTQTALTLMLKR